MADTVTTVEIVHQRNEPPASVEDKFLVAGPHEGVSRVAEHLHQIAGGVRGGEVRVTVESSTAVAAAGTCVADVSDATAGDTLDVYVPGYGVVGTITVVATGGTNSEGNVNADAADDTAFGLEIANAFNTYPPLKRHFTASNSTGTVTVTAKRAGSWGNAIVFTETASSNSPFAPTSPSGGVDHGARATIDIVCGTPDIVADDTLRIGGTTFTWKASASTESEVTLSTTPATAATNLGAKINAHSALQGLFTASVSTDTVTVTYNGPPRAGEQIFLIGTETNVGSVTVGGVAVTTGAAMSSGSTEAYQAATKTYALGAA